MQSPSTHFLYVQVMYVLGTATALDITFEIQLLRQETVFKVGLRINTNLKQKLQKHN